MPRDLVLTFVRLYERVQDQTIAQYEVKALERISLADLNILVEPMMTAYEQHHSVGK